MAHDVRKIIFPYCLKRLSDGKYIVLNRNYKPVGFDTAEHLKYEDYPIAHKIKGLTKKQSKIFLGMVAMMLNVFIYIMMVACQQVVLKILINI